MNTHNTQVSLKWKPEAALTVVMAAKGYPSAYKKGSVIKQLGDVKTAKVRIKKTMRI